jgi:hypothetical protein
MAVFDLYSKRQKKERGEVPDVFAYDKIPEQLRTQIVLILRDVIGASTSQSLPVYDRIVRILGREYGTFSLADGHSSDDILENFIAGEENVDRVLDAVEMSFVIAGAAMSNNFNYMHYAGSKMSLKDGVQELNKRFLEHGIGYEYASGTIIKKDSEFLHAEAIRPALVLLQNSRYKGANEEFLKAHEHYRHGAIKDSLVYCLKALESTLKTICEIRGWPFRPTDTAKTLLDICFQNELVPSFWQSHYTALRSTLESGVPTGRNKLAGHGQGSEVLNVPPHYASYMLNMTGSVIQFLISSEAQLVSTRTDSKN